MMQFEFRRAAREDIPKLTDFFRETIVDVYGHILSREKLEPWVEGDMMSREVNNLWQNMIVAEQAGEVMGVAARADDMIQLLWIHPAHQRKGIGSVLLDLVETELQKSGYDQAKMMCFSDNDLAMEFYRARGWKPLCEEMSEELGIRVMVMTKVLTDESGDAPIGK